MKKSLITVFLSISFVLITDCSNNPPLEATKPAENYFPSGLMFDDFSYSATTDPLLSQNGWTLRSGSGGPGPAGCVWDPALLSFVRDASDNQNILLSLSALTKGSATSCRQAEILSSLQFRKGTFAARILFSDQPDYGVDNDGLVQTFFTIASWDEAENDAYCEFDFEYLPNGGWGKSGSTMWETSWETVNDHKSDPQSASHAGSWQTLIIQADTAKTCYIVNNELRVTHEPPYVVDGVMSINFNHWFIAELLQDKIHSERKYTYFVDWVFAMSDSVIMPNAVDSLVTELRINGKKYYNSLHTF